MNDQRDMFDRRFAGDDYADDRDRPRLGKQLRRVFDTMKDGEWHTIDKVAEETGGPVQSIARQIRWLRSKRFGGHTIDRRHVGNGLYEYRLTSFGGEAR